MSVPDRSLPHATILLVEDGICFGWHKIPVGMPPYLHMKISDHLSIVDVGGSDGYSSHLRLFRMWSCADGVRQVLPRWYVEGSLTG
jgi:hypothetical protein